MHKIALAAVVSAALAMPGAALALSWSPGQTGTVGAIITATDPQGNTRQVVQQSVQITPPTGTSATQVQGAAAAGAAPVGNPVYLGAQDGNSSNVMAGLTALNWGDGNSGGQKGLAVTAATEIFNNSLGGVKVRDITGALASGNAGTGTTAVEEGGTAFSEITTAASTSVKASAGILHKVVVNTCVASATIKIYNATSATGTPITITCPSTVGNPFFIDYDAYFSTGIFVVTSGATDVTVGYR